MEKNIKENWKNKKEKVVCIESDDLNQLPKIIEKFEKEYLTAVEKDDICMVWDTSVILSYNIDRDDFNDCIEITLKILNSN